MDEEHHGKINMVHFTKGKEQHFDLSAMIISQGHTAPRFLSFQRINRPACFSLSKNNKQSSYQTAQENGLLTTESCSVESEAVM